MQQWATVPMNERQLKVLGRLLDGFEGKLTSSQWPSVAKCSPSTALRDINDPLARGVLRKTEGGGRSSGYALGEWSLQQQSENSVHPSVKVLPTQTHGCKHAGRHVCRVRACVYWGVVSACIHPEQATVRFVEVGADGFIRLLRFYTAGFAG